MHEVTKVPYMYRHLPIGGGGYVTGFFFHPTDPNTFYCRTDIGGMYRFDYEKQVWISLIDHVNHEDLREACPISAALDAKNAQKLFVISGAWKRDSDGLLTVSGNGGKTFAKKELPFFVLGNLHGRGAGERLCYDGKRLWMASQLDGLWYSDDEGDTVKRCEAFAEMYNIGDTVTIESGEQTCTYEVTGFIQSVNYQGTVCGLTTEGYEALCGEIAMPSLYVYLKDGASADAVISRCQSGHPEQIIKAINAQKMTQTTQEMYMSISAALIAVIFLVTLLIVLFILYIVIRSLLVRRKQELGIMKAMGYTSGQLMLQTAGSFLPVTIVAVLLSAALGMVYMPFINQVIFSSVGAVRNNLEISFAFLMIFAAVLIALNFAISICLTLPIRKISAYALIKE